MRVESLPSVYTVKLSRGAGDLWAYKDLATKVMTTVVL
jgi:hypothetical protein